MFKEQKSEIQQIHFSGISKKDISLQILREDKLHPEISGNKYRKLKYNLLKAKELKKDTLLTFGGAFSNHIAATAAAGEEFNFQTIGVIRGDELGMDLNETLKKNPTLRFAAERGMKFEFVSREAYREKNTDAFLKQLDKKFKNFYLVPEGGTNELAVKGCEEILHESTVGFDYICTAVGTGGTLSGLINSALNNQRLIGFPALKGDFLKKEIVPYVLSRENWSLNTEFHFGGYARINDSLINFINEFYRETKIPLDPIYTGKMMYGLVSLINRGYFDKGESILAIHTGGLQGIEGMNMLLKKKNMTVIDR